ncbi:MULTISPECIES: hypothetical protein [Pseudoalteromonas]|uniref:Uncharacterized protein n=1 Tax=Pseudoalteromonas amylolytica TaxID=1859457 RepID=A0A1S1MYC6_9GAMM|nr:MULTISPECIES: hypothetical protein [Pseudoalteromonas]OHU89178.1 hypothetical protein BFC16_05945 [Pseudoalteromonas sp. JW3]OHU92078.1 hypothetical protein BET10_07050 [Pseudoalteromonas amylolytica]
MEKIELGVEPVTFQHDLNGENVFFCVGQTDFERFGVECVSKRAVLKGVSDDESEAIHDYMMQVILSMSDEKPLSSSGTH